MSNTPSGALCLMTTEQFCTSHGGTFRGVGTTCATANCPPPSGACCLPGGQCEVLTPAACAVAQGIYRGNNVPCSAGHCGEAAGSGSPIRGDWNNDLFVNVVDIQDFLAAFSAGLGDINGDGACDSRDVALFMQMVPPTIQRVR